MNIFKLCKWYADIKMMRTTAVEGTYLISIIKQSQSRHILKNNSEYLLNNTYVYCLHNIIDYDL